MTTIKINSAKKKVLTVFIFLLVLTGVKALSHDNGYYIKVNSDSVGNCIYQKLVVTPNENCWMTTENLLEAYIYIPSGVNGFSIVKIDDGAETTFSPRSNVKEVKDWLYYEPQPQANFIRGEFEVGKAPFTVSESGLYYIAAEVNTRWMACLPIKKWNILGTSIPGGWEPSQLKLLSPVFSEDKKSAVFSIDSLVIKPGFFKFRFTNGWKITIDSISDNECWNKGAKVNTNFGGSADSLVLGGNNIHTNDRGVFNVKLFWESGKYLKASFTKVKDIDLIDYSNHKMGILGDAYFYANGKKSNWEHNWGEGNETNLPIKNGSVYTWTFSNIKLLNGGEFKIRQGHDWMGLAIDFQDVKKWSGNAKDDFKNMDSKFHVINSGEAIYDIVLQIDANSDDATIRVDKK